MTGPRRVNPLRAFDLLQTVLRECLAPGSPWALHPGELAFWVHHADPDTEVFECWAWDDTAWVAFVDDHGAFAFARPGVDIRPHLAWASQRGLESISFVPDSRPQAAAHLRSLGFAPDGDGAPILARPTAGEPPPPPQGWSVRSLHGEAEANARRAASHAAFGSTLDEASHLKRYLHLMRSPVYRADRDIVAVDREGTVGAFAVWWSDDGGIAQLEPVGTDPAFGGRGLGRAVVGEAISRMLASGMHTVRVSTAPEPGGGASFYRAIGFTEVDSVQTWSRVSG